MSTEDIKKEEHMDNVESTKEEVKNTEVESENTEQTKVEETNAEDNKYNELEDKYIRLRAEYQNFTKRSEAELSRYLRYAKEDIALDLLSIIDNFELALKTQKDGEDSFTKGINMIHNNLVDILKKHEISEIDALNKPFDSFYHDAVMTECNDDEEDGIVLEILRKGYMYKDKVLREALVKVNKK